MQRMRSSLVKCAAVYVSRTIHDVIVYTAHMTTCAAASRHKYVITRNLAIIYIFIHQYGSAQKENTNIQTKSSIKKKKKKKKKNIANIAIANRLHICIV